MYKKAFQNDGGWYPSADVEIMEQYEYISQNGGKSLGVTLVIHNTSNMSIRTGTIIIKVETNRRKYLHTASAEGKIIPGEKLAFSVSISYLDAGESLLPGCVTVHNAFFD